MENNEHHLPDKDDPQDFRLQPETVEAERSRAAAQNSAIVEKPVEPPRRVSCEIAGDGSFGRCMADLRIRHKYTIAQLAEETKISGRYLEALEAEDYKNLPQVVYVMGYIRKLCALYGVSREDADQLTAGLRERLQYELPEDISKTVIDHEISEENERKMRQLLILISAGGVLLAAALILGAVLILVGIRNNGGGSARSGEPFNEALLIELQPKPELQMQELK